MLSIIKFYIKQHYVLIIACLLTIVLDRVLGLIRLDSLPILLAWVLLYQFNVSEKEKKNWYFFHSLPISLSQKALVKIIIPFFFVLMLYISARYTTLSVHEKQGMFAGYLIKASIFVFASIYARSIVSYVLSCFGIFLVVEIVQFILVEVFGYVGSEIIIAITLLTLSYIYFSSKRIQVKKALSIAFVCAIPLGLAGEAINRKLNHWIMYNGDIQKQISAAVFLLEQKDDHEAAKHISKVINAIPTVKQLESVLDTFSSSSNLKIELSVEQWDQIISLDQDKREAIFNYLRQDYRKYQWLNFNKIKSYESLVFRGNNECRTDCYALAKLMKKFKDEIDWNHFSDYLASSSLEKINFSLTVIESQDAPVLLPEIFNIMDNPSKDVQEKVIDILSGWTTESMANELDKLKEEIENDLGQANSIKLKEFFRAKLGN